MANTEISGFALIEKAEAAVTANPKNYKTLTSVAKQLTTLAETNDLWLEPLLYIARHLIAGGNTNDWEGEILLNFVGIKTKERDPGLNAATVRTMINYAVRGDQAILSRLLSALKIATAGSKEEKRAFAKFSEAMKTEEARVKDEPRARDTLTHWAEATRAISPTSPIAPLAGNGFFDFLEKQDCCIIFFGEYLRQGSKPCPVIHKDAAPRLISLLNNADEYAAISIYSKLLTQLDEKSDAYRLVTDGVVHRLKMGTLDFDLVEKSLPSRIENKKEPTYLEKSVKDYVMHQLSAMDADERCQLLLDKQSTWGSGNPYLRDAIDTSLPTYADQCKDTNIACQTFILAMEDATEGEAHAIAQEVLSRTEPFYQQNKATEAVEIAGKLLSQTSPAYVRESILSDVLHNVATHVANPSEAVALLTSDLFAGNYLATKFAQKDTFKRAEGLSSATEKVDAYTHIFIKAIDTTFLIRPEDNHRKQAEELIADITKTWSLEQRTAYVAGLASKGLYADNEIGRVNKLLGIPTDGPQRADLARFTQTLKSALA